jgi:hypothetical protein
VAIDNQISRRADAASIFFAYTSATTVAKYVSFEKPARELQLEGWHGDGGGNFRFRRAQHAE